MGLIASINTALWAARIRREGRRGQRVLLFRTAFERTWKAGDTWEDLYGDPWEVVAVEAEPTREAGFQWRVYGRRLT